MNIQQSVVSSSNNQAFGHHRAQKEQNGQTRPQLVRNEIQSQFQKLKKPSETIQRQTSLPTPQPEFTRIANTAGSTYSDNTKHVPAYAESLRTRRSSDSDFKKASREAIVGEIERLVSFDRYRVVLVYC